MKESRANRVFQVIVGVLFVGFGLLYLLTNQVTLNIAGWALGGVVALGALIRLIVVCLPSSVSFAGSASSESVIGICEALFGIVFVLNAMLYMEFFYPLVAGLLAIMAVVRFAQSASIKKRGDRGWGSYVLIGVLLLFAAAGLAVVSYVYRIELQFELIGAAALLYGFFLVASASFKHGAAAEPVYETPAFEASEQPEAVEELGSEQKLG